MRAGELRHRLTIQQQTIIRDGFGAEVPTWTPLATVWAQVETISGTESIDAAQVTTATLAYTVTIRWRSDVTPTMRVIWGARTLTIRSVMDPENTRRQLVLGCDEVVDHGDD